MASKDIRHTHFSGSGSSRTHEPSRILVVDDEVAVLFAYRRLFEGGGYVVDTCETLVEAVEYVKNSAYFAIITDLRLTGSDSTEGLELLACVRECQPRANVIMLTGYGGKESLRSSIELGAAFYFKKPLEPSVILEALRHLREEAAQGSRRDVNCMSKVHQKTGVTAC